MIHALPLGELLSVGSVMVPFMKPILFLANKAVCTAYAHNSQFLPSNLIVVMIALGESEGCKKYGD